MARTVGSYQKRTFLDTNLGRYIFLHDENVFNLVCPNNEVGVKPSLKLILFVCNASKNNSFKNKRFFGYVDQYEKNGLRVARKKPITQEIIDHYNNIKKRRIKNIIKKQKK